MSAIREYKTKSGEKRYETVACVSGIKKHFTAATKDELRKLVAEYTMTKEERFNSSTVAKCIDDFININRNILSPSTIKAYESYRKNYLQGIMNIKARDLNSKILQTEINKDSRRTSSKTVKNSIGLLSASLKMAGMVLPNIKLPQREKTEIYIPTKQEIEELIDKSTGELKTAIMLGVYLGLRRSEIVALTINDYDGKVLKINKAVVHYKGKDIIKNTKTTSSTRTLRVPEVLKKHLDEKVKTGYIVNYNIDSLSTTFDRFRKKYGFEKIRFHDLRHYFVSTLMAQNVPNAYIRSYTGHTSDNMINSVYGHLLPEKQKEVADVLDSVFK